MLAPSEYPGANQHEEHRRGDDVATISRPQLQQVFAPQLVVDFAKNIAHKLSRPHAPNGRTISARLRRRKPRRRTELPSCDRRQPVAAAPAPNRHIAAQDTWTIRQKWSK